MILTSLNSFALGVREGMTQLDEAIDSLSGVIHEMEKILREHKVSTRVAVKIGSRMLREWNGAEVVEATFLAWEKCDGRYQVCIAETRDSDPGGDTPEEDLPSYPWNRCSPEEKILAAPYLAYLFQVLADTPLQKAKELTRAREEISKLAAELKSNPTRSAAA